MRHAVNAYNAAGTTVVKRTARANEKTSANGTTWSSVSVTVANTRFQGHTNGNHLHMATLEASRQLSILDLSFFDPSTAPFAIVLGHVGVDLLVSKHGTRRFFEIHLGGVLMDSGS